MPSWQRKWSERPRLRLPSRLPAENCCLHGLGLDRSAEPERVAALRKAQATVPSEPVPRREMPRLHPASASAGTGSQERGTLSFQAGLRLINTCAAIPIPASTAGPEQLQEVPPSSSSSAQTLAWQQACGNPGLDTGCPCQHANGSARGAERTT